MNPLTGPLSLPGSFTAVRPTNCRVRSRLAVSQSETCSKGNIRRQSGDTVAAAGFVPGLPCRERRTTSLAKEMIAAGLKGIATCRRIQSPSGPGIGWCRLDRTILSELPAWTGPLAAHGEFHTRRVGGPVFPSQIEGRLRRVVRRKIAEDAPIGTTGCSREKPGNLPRP